MALWLSECDVNKFGQPETFNTYLACLVFSQTRETGIVKMRCQFSLVALATFLVLAVLLLPAINAKSSTGVRTLVLLDKQTDQVLYSKFWESLKGRGFLFDFRLATDDKLTILVNEERVYDHIIIFSPKVKSFGGSVTPKSLIEFMKDGGNILLAINPTASETIRDFSREFDIDFDDRDKYVIDHFSYNVKSGEGDHTVIVADGYSNRADAIISDSARAAPVLFHGSGHRIGSVPLLTPVLSASSAAYSAEKATGEVLDEDVMAGKEISLVSAFQTRNNARAVFAGSLDMFSDRFFDAPVRKYGKDQKEYKKSGNEDFIADLTKWVFQEKSVLKVVSTKHHKVDATEQMSWYRVMDNITYTLEISEYKDDRWVPFIADDIQLEIIMLDPYIRTYLKQAPAPSNAYFGRFTTNVQLPDVYGVFTFKVNYKRPGLSYLETRYEVSIRPFRHNEYPRYLTAAYPYYAGSWSMIAGFLLFSAVWLGTWGIRKPDTKNKKKT